MSSATTLILPLLPSAHPVNMEQPDRLATHLPQHPAPSDRSSLLIPLDPSSVRLGSSPRLIPAPSRPLTPHPFTLLRATESPPSPDLRAIIRNSPQRSVAARSATGSVTVRPLPAILGSQQSTLRPLPHQLLPAFHLASAPIPSGNDKTWEETDSLTARPRPLWISSLGEPKMVDEVDAEMCVLCGRERSRADVEVKEFQLGVAALMCAPGSQPEYGSSSNERKDETRHAEMTASGVGETKIDAEDGDERIDLGGLGVGRWMVCRDTASCDRAVETVMSSEDDEQTMSS